MRSVRIRRRLARIGIDHFQWTPRVRTEAERAEVVAILDRLISAGQSDVLRGLPLRASSAHDLLMAGRRNDLDSLTGVGPRSRVMANLYFIQNTSTGLIKIGVARSVETRRKDLEKACGVPLSVLCVVHRGAKYERPLHQMFAASRRVGEWFAPSSELLNVIQNPQSSLARWGGL